MCEQGAFLIKAKPHAGRAVQPMLAGRLGSRAERWDWLGTAGGINGQENMWPAADGLAPVSWQLLIIQPTVLLS